MCFSQTRSVLYVYKQRESHMSLCMSGTHMCVNTHNHTYLYECFVHKTYSTAHVQKQRKSHICHYVCFVHKQ